MPQIFYLNSLHNLLYHYELGFPSYFPLNIFLQNNISIIYFGNIFFNNIFLHYNINCRGACTMCLLLNALSLVLSVGFYT